MPVTLRDLATNADIRDRIFLICDIDAAPDEPAPNWITVDGSTDFSVIARDGTGGLFLVMPGSPRIVYASSEGQAGVLAAGLEELMTLIVTCPYYESLLQYSGNGNVDEMRRAAPFSQGSWMGDEDEFAAARAFLKELGIAEPKDVIGALHRAVSTPVDVRFHDQPAMPLFGRFVIEDNPFYRMQKG